MLEIRRNCGLTRSLSRAVLPALALCATSICAHADQVVLGRLTASPIENLKTIVPHKVSLTDKKPAAITAEPTYKGTPQYGSIVLGNSSKSKLWFALDTFPGDRLPRLYINLSGEGDLSKPSAFIQLKPLLEFAADAGGKITGSVPKSGVPIGAVVPATARYTIKGEVQEVKAPILFTFLGDELDFAIAVEHVGTLNVEGTTYKIALTDMASSLVFDKFNHTEEEPARVKLLVDINGDGKFDPKREAFDLAKPFRLGGKAYEIASVDPKGTIVALQTTTKRPEGAIGPDDLAVGVEIIDFVAKSMDSKQIQFPGGYKHKVVMLDFWATWCGPCVAEVPNVVAVYNQYHNYGFDIVSVSLDRANSAQTVTDFCQQANMTWPEIYDGGYWNAAVAKIFAIQAIPMSYLVDGDTGVILAMGDSLRGEGLQAAVTKALTKKGLLSKQQ